jgi:hypothetical protein
VFAIEHGFDFVLSDAMLGFPADIPDLSAIEVVADSLLHRGRQVFHGQLGRGGSTGQGEYCEWVVSFRFM